MNILPKKRWHVRTKENIARVRKDEAEAAAKEKEEQVRIEKADREARLNILKHKSKEHLQKNGIGETTEYKTPSTHINLFTDYENAVKTTNIEHDREVTEKKEEYEKKIGYLTYLGQDTNEALGKKNWYEVPPETSRYSHTGEIKDTYEKLVLKDEDGKPKTKDLDIKDGEVSWKKKQMLDPINAFKKYLHNNKVSSHRKPVKNTDLSALAASQLKSKTTKSKGYEKDAKLKKLRELRLKREQHEKYRTELLLHGLHKPVTNNVVEKDTRVKAKYNSQFNPELARQNYT